jgi:transposase
MAPRVHLSDRQWRRTGVPWRDLPDAFGPWKTVYNRFDRWAKSGKWKRLFEALKLDGDDEWSSVDSTINRVHQHAAGARGGAERHAIGRSRGGLTTKVHLVVDALGLPMDFELTEGQRHDSQPAPTLIERCRPRCLLADKAYDSDALRAQLRQMGCDAVIPPKTNRVTMLDWDLELYKARSDIECTFNLLKQARRFATRYEKTLRNYAAVVAIGCALLWLR